MKPISLLDACFQCLLRPQHRAELIELTSRMRHDPYFLLYHKASTELVLSNILRRYGIDPRTVFLEYTPEEILGGASRLLHQ